jgi:putative SOS response-associated peptidase YedK
VLEEGAKQPYFITPVDGQPLYFTGLSSTRAEEDARDGYGFVIVTDAAEAGMLDIHDRRPLVLSAQDARHWLEPSTSFDEALALATDSATPADAFHWFPVSKAVNSVANNVPEFNEPIQREED